MTENLRVGIVGTGLIGGKRADALKSIGDKVAAVADRDESRAKAFAEKVGSEAVARWEDLVGRKDIDTVVVSTSNDAIPQIALAALEAGKHVFVEKPAGRFPEEIRRLAKAAEDSRGTLGVGFNHRFHPAILRAFELLKSGSIGPVMYVRARYGHGGRIGYDREWRANPEICGGGELLDQGVHLIDLSRWFAGEFDLDTGRAVTTYWDMPVEDNGFLILKGQGTTAFLHASCTEWKNTFDFEIFGKKGKLQIVGLGGSYGTETLKYYRVKPQMGVPDEEISEFTGADLSWKNEWESFRAKIEGRPSEVGTITDALRAVEIIHAAYRQSSKPYAK